MLSTRAIEQRGDEVQLLVGDANGIAERTGRVAYVDRTRRTSLGLAFPEQLRISGGDGADDLKLTGPRVIDAQSFYLRVAYAATDGRRRLGTAFCEIAYPHRLRWPVLGRMIELVIDRQPSGPARQA